MILWWLCPALAVETVLVTEGSDWNYLDTGVAPGSDWYDPDFDDTAWAVGQAPLGYGLFDVLTDVDSGPDPSDVHITTWFRHTFNVVDASAFETLALYLRRDDGARVYLNGSQLHRSNMPLGPLGPDTLAESSVVGPASDIYHPVPLSADLLVDGDNVLAVEVHQDAADGTDLILDLALSAWDEPTAVTRGPYLQRATNDSMIVRWRTDGPSESRVWHGDAPGALLQTTDDSTIVFDHEVRVSALGADAEVAYAVGTTAGLVMVGDDTDHVFRTAPNPGTRRPVRIWVLGDSGTADANAEAVRDAYAVATPDPLDTDLWLMLGDNAYNSGTDFEFQSAVFDFYPEMLRQVPLWSCLGNHEGYTSFSDTQTGPYFDIHSFPTLGEVGGAPSGTEAYYSFDYANVHVVVLDSYHSDRLPSSPMLQWLDDDLAGVSADWTIAIWHHPPYSKGSHDSDREGGLIEMRQYALPILEDHGVDLVLSGHSHSYERSKLIDGHYETSDLFDPLVHLQQDHDGDPGNEGAYTKPTSGPASHQGAVFVVAGSSGKVSGGSLDHPVMQLSTATLGSLILDIDGDELSGTFLDDLGGEPDHFAIHKAVTTILEMPRGLIGAEGEVVQVTGFALQADGNEPPLYTWDFGDSTPEATGSQVPHAWQTEGSYVATLTVTDAGGQQASDTAVVYCDNGPPVIDSISSGVADEGTPTTLTATASDPSNDPLSFVWVLDDGITELYGPTVQATFFDDGLASVILEVTDDATQTTTSTFEVTVNNVAPTLDGVTWVDAEEGTLATGTAFTIDPGQDTVSVHWSFPDGTEADGITASTTFPDDGSYSVDLVLSDEDGGVTETTIEVIVTNADPTVTELQLGGALDEGSPVELTAVGSDPGASDVLTYTWDFGDGSLDDSGALVVHTFADDGPWPVTITADDGEGGLGSATFDVELRNLPPEIRTATLPSATVEGAPTTFAVQAEDPGTDDVLTYEWAMGDGGTADSPGVVWTYADEGVYLASVSVSDDDGGGETLLVQIPVSNAPPVFTSLPTDLQARAGRPWTYDAIAEDPGDDTLAFSLEGPPGATVDANGTVYWVPALNQVGDAVWMTLTVDDGDGGSTTQAWPTLVVDPAGVRGPADRLDRDDAAAGGCGCTATPSSGGPFPALAVAGLAMLLGLRRREVCGYALARDRASSGIDLGPRPR